MGCLRALREAAGEGAQVLLCTDLWKAPARLKAAYDDSEGAGPLRRRGSQQGPARVADLGMHMKVFTSRLPPAGLRCCPWLQV